MKKNKVLFALIVNISICFATSFSLPGMIVGAVVALVILAL